MAEAFTWGSGGEKLSPADRRRRIADAMMKAGMDYSPVQHWTQGLNRVAQAMIGGYEARQADDEEKAGRAAVTGLMPELFGNRTAATPAAPSMASGGEPRTMNMPADMKTGIADAAGALGISPVDLATVISYETGGTFDPTQAGPRTKWGQHRGLIQFGEPQAKQYGVDWSNPAASQLGANGAIVAYMRDRGVKPGMGLMDIYSTVNAGAPGLYDRSDAHAGGAPGTVADKVNNQMAGHRAKAQAMFRQAQADLPAPGASPVAMETGQPGFAVPQAPAADALPIMQEGGALPNFDPATGRWLGPSNPPALAAAPAPQLEQQPAAEDPVQPLPPVFQSEGVSQPWMNTAVMPPPPEPQAPVPQSAPLPPPRPANLAMPQADLPAPGAAPAIGMTTPPLPARPEIDPNSPDGGMRAFQAAEAANAPGNASIFDRIAAAMGGGAPQAAAPSSPGVARVAAAAPAPVPATPAAASPGVERVAAAVPQQDGQLAAAMRVLNSPYAAPGQRAIAQAIVERSMKGTDYESVTRPDGSVWRVPKTGGGAPVQVFGPQSKPAEPGSQVQVFRDEKTGEIISVDKTKTGAGSGSEVVRPGKPRPDDNMDAEGKLRGEFSGRIKEFGTVQDAYGRIVASVQNRVANPQEKSPASDIALVFGYMKMLDPGSVVREGEYATAQNAAGIPERVRNYYNKAIDGEFLDPKQRDDMVATAGRLYKQARGTAMAEGKRYRDLASSYGLNPDRIVALPEELIAPKTAAVPPPGVGTASPAAPSAIAAPKSKAEYDALPSGTPYTAPDGKQRVKP